MMGIANPKQAAWVVAIVAILLLAWSQMKSFRLPGEEYALISRIEAAETEAERNRLIADLERMPVRIYPFHSRWMLINDIQPFECWREDGYDPSRSEVPRDIQLLWATSYGKSDIDNGGFHQFFTNSTGDFAPEMVEWFDRAGLKDTAEIVRTAMAVFGDTYPRSQTARQQFLQTFEGESRAEWDPFAAMDEPFYDSLHVFDEAADRWLRETCGVKNLHQTLDGRGNR
jgi:hypothetical protein